MHHLLLLELVEPHHALVLFGESAQSGLVESVVGEDFPAEQMIEKNAYFK